MLQKVSRVLLDYIFSLFLQTALESLSLMMAPPVQFIYSCYFPLNQTQTCGDGWERDRIIHTVTAFSDDIFVLFTSLLFYSCNLFLYVCCINGHTHTQCSLALTCECVLGQNKRFFVRSYISVLILIRDVICIPNPVWSHPPHFMDTLRCVHMHTYGGDALD